MHTRCGELAGSTHGGNFTGEEPYVGFAWGVNRPGTSGDSLSWVVVTEDPVARIAQLEKENRVLRRANAILESASAFFAAELERLITMQGVGVV